MVLVISQETFNDAVKENIEDFGLSPEEAVEETVKQFESQGVNLSHIVKEVMTNPSNSEAVENAVKKLKDLNNGKSSAEELINQLQLIKTECDKGIQFKIFAGKAGAYNTILDTLEKFKTDAVIVGNCLTALISLMTQQPDLLDDRGVKVISELFNKDTDCENKKLVLKWAKECCVMHEMNRQKIFNSNILEKLKELLQDGNSELLKGVLGVCRALVLDDDVRVEFGRAHEHARVIASETLLSLVGLSNRFQSDEPLIHDLMLTLSALLVRTEFCKTVEEADGLQLIHDVMNSFSNCEKINKQCFKLLKALAGNDDCKVKIIQKNLAPVISNNLNIHKEKAVTATAGLSCVAALSLRCPDNSKALFDAGLPEVIVDVMKAHSDEKNVQRTASWAIRNMVSRSRYQNEKFVELGVEDILQDSSKKFKAIEYDIKAALRDLGCNVDLKEEWTGKGGMLTSGLSTEKE